MRVRIQNLGNVESGDIDISKKLTVFCGPNNTGKTYVSYIIYSLIKAQYYFDDQINQDLSKLIADGEMVLSIDEGSLLKYRQRKMNIVSHSLESIFGISDKDKLSLFSKLEMHYGLSDKEFISSVKKYSLDYTMEWAGLMVRVYKESGKMQISVKRTDKESSFTDDVYLFSMRFKVDLYNRLINYPFVQSSIFPVERNSIYTFNKELSIQRNELIEQMQALKENRKIGYDSVDRLLGRSTRYPLAIRDCLSVANDLNNLKKRTSEYASFSEMLEQKLLGGKISVTKEGEVEFVPKRGQRLPIHLSASIVKTLSSLTFYLKHLATRGDLIIIDEPEMNLHPDAQVVLARVLALLVNKGLNLLISTHSDYIIRELNNLITLGSIQDRAEVMAELGYEEEEVLNADNVSVYLFKPRKKNSKLSTIIPVPVKEDGFSMETIDNVIFELNSNSDRITYKLQYNE